MKKNYVLFIILTLGLLPALNHTNAQDAFLSNLAIPRYVKTNQSYTVSVRARNAANTAYNSLKISYQLNDNPIVQGSNINLSGNGLGLNSYLPFNSPVPFSISSAGVNTIKIWIDVAGDSNSSNDTLKYTFTALSSYASKTVLMEVRTATWCPHCPGALSSVADFSNQANIAVAKFHTSDQFSTTVGDQYFSAYNSTGTPNGMIDMGDWGTYQVNSAHPTWANEVESRMAGVSPVAITASPSYNSETRTLTLEISANFHFSETSEYIVNAILVENNLAGPQSNAPSGFIHNQVVRDILGGRHGTSGIIPDNPIVGTIYTHTYSKVLPQTWKPQDVEFIVNIVSRKSSSQKLSLNATKGKITNQVNIAKINSNENNLVVFPNPFSNDVAVKIPFKGENLLLDIYATDGKLVFNQSFSNYQVDNEIRLNLIFGDLPKGVYFIRLRDGEKYSYAKIIKG